MLIFGISADPPRNDAFSPLALQPAVHGRPRAEIHYSQCLFRPIQAELNIGKPCSLRKTDSSGKIRWVAGQRWAQIWANGALRSGEFDARDRHTLFRQVFSRKILDRRMCGFRIRVGLRRPVPDASLGTAKY